jgi:hypothetical protein
MAAERDARRCCSTDSHLARVAVVGAGGDGDVHDGRGGVDADLWRGQEVGRPLCGPTSPRPTSEAELWQCATPARFEAYLTTGESEDMVGHYYDKLLHVARPPKEIVRNPYLEQAAEESSVALVELLLRFGRSGQVDEEYIEELARQYMR